MKRTKAIEHAIQLVNDYYKDTVTFFPPENQDWARYVVESLLAQGYVLDRNLVAYVRQSRLPIVPEQLEKPLIAALSVGGYKAAEKIMSKIHGHGCVIDPQSNPVYQQAAAILNGCAITVSREEVRGFSMSSYETLRRVVLLNGPGGPDPISAFDKLNVSLRCV